MLKDLRALRDKCYEEQNYWLKLMESTKKGTPDYEFFLDGFKIANKTVDKLTDLIKRQKALEV